MNELKKLKKTKTTTTTTTNHSEAAAEIAALNLDARTKDDFLIYANAVNRARAIPVAEDNLKPIHRKILYTFYLTKLTSEKEPKKSRATVGEVLKLSPHGDAATYGALVRLAQGWKLRYPLVERQGNCGNLLGRPPAAARYTNAKLSPIGDMMLADIDKDCVDFVPNYDETRQEPVTLPSKFPWLLCGNNNGIGVSLSSSIVSHNFTEVKAAIEYYLDCKRRGTLATECTVENLMKFIQGPDFPTGGRIRNGEDLVNIYKTGVGVLKRQPHYDIIRGPHKLAIVFHDLPYGVEIDSGVKAPLKKMVIDEPDTVGKDFENIEIRKTKNNFFDITITLNPKANVAKCLNILLTKTHLSESVKVNNTVIDHNGKIVTLNLVDRIRTYVDYRSRIIRRIAQNDYDKTNHKLTVILGLQKCMSDIDSLIHLIRFADNRYAALQAIRAKFDLTEEQGNAVLDRKLSKLSKLDIADLNKNEANLEEQLARLKKVVEDENERYKIIKQDLAEIKAKLGEDARLTEILSGPVEGGGLPAAAAPSDGDGRRRSPVVGGGSGRSLSTPRSQGRAKLSSQLVYRDGQILPYLISDKDICGVVSEAAAPSTIITYTADGHTQKGGSADNAIGLFERPEGGKNQYDCFVTVTAAGLVKVSALADYLDSRGRWKQRADGRLLRLKANDKLIFAAPCNYKKDTLVFTESGGKMKRLPVSKFNITAKMTQGVSCSGDGLTAAAVATSGDKLLFLSKGGAQSKITEVSKLATATGSLLSGDAIVSQIINLHKWRTEIYAVAAKASSSQAVTVFAIDVAKKTRGRLTTKTGVKCFY